MSSEKAKGIIAGAQGNLMTVEFEGIIRQNEVVYLSTGGKNLKGEVIEIDGRKAKVQIFEPTRGVKCGDAVEFTSELLSVELGPGLLQNVYDGLQNPLEKIAEENGYFLPRGVYLAPLDQSKKWDFTPIAKTGDTVSAASYLGRVPEAVIDHKIMVPFGFNGNAKVIEIKPAGSYTINEVIAKLQDESGKITEVTMVQKWPAKFPIKVGTRLFPDKQLFTKCRIVDGPFPVAKGGTFCTPGPFGAGKTVLQHQISKYAETQVVIVVACGERAGEVVEILKEFPHLDDPQTGKKLMDRTCIICNTSSMPVAARESSIYVGTTIAEYYRQMGVDTLLLADSTSRWAQALREMSGRLEEIPGEEAFPAYLASRIAEFYERAGVLKNPAGDTGSLTIGGAVSPAGGNFEEPVTQSTLAVVGCFLGLSRERSDARRFPAIDPLISWSKYLDRFYDEADSETKARIDVVRLAQSMILEGDEIGKKMSVVGEEGVSIDDMVVFLKGEFYDSVFLQQNAFDSIDTSSDRKRQNEQLEVVGEVLRKKFSFQSKEDARKFFLSLSDDLIQLNYIAKETDDYKRKRESILATVRGA
ncbi:MAG TPA: V-type ATP synthase subunit A [Spirochaetota bacterium]|nr:V-type ATP synthase subunit A [Spirochaetota bacterium]HOR45073.1 V-type ATP synthase subunit A [Spirochaetota bacterium]HOU83652.1 V-type ATP synthase subunit A [Spirochaetota bacterium]HPK56731.1 V-type ATP synthase subunit A [Spirochaetota bacterium]